MKTLVISLERTEYTLDLIRNVYAPRGIEVKFLDEIGCLGLLGELKRHDALVVNSYSELKCVALLVLNALFFRRPIGIDADSQLRIPQGMLRRGVKRLWLGWLFTRPWCWGFAGGTVTHCAFYQHYGMDEQKIKLMPMMVDNSRYSCIADQRNGDEVCRFGYVGRLVAHKNVDIAIRALAELIGRGVKATLDVVGRGPAEKRLAALAEACGVGECVRFRGFLVDKDKVEAYRNMDALVLPSRYEPWGLVVNEAMASGLATIVSDEVGARYDLVKDDCGLVVKTGDVEALADAMGQLATDPAKRRAMGTCAFARMSGWNYRLYGKCWDGWTGGL